MTTIREFYWPNGERPGWALRWDIEHGRARVDVCPATTASYVDGRPDEDVVMSEGDATDDMPLDGPWKEEFTVEIKFDGFARLWCDDLQLGTAAECASLLGLFTHLYARAEQLLAVEWAECVERRKQNAIDAALRIANSHERIRRRKP